MALGFMLGAAAVLFVGFVGVAALTPVYHRDIINIVLWVLIPVVSASFDLAFVRNPVLPEWLLAVLVFGVPTLMGFVLTYNMVGVVSPVYARIPEWVLRTLFEVEEDEMTVRIEKQKRVEKAQWVRANLYVLSVLGGAA